MYEVYAYNIELIICKVCAKAPLTLATSVLSTVYRMFHAPLKQLM